MRKFKFRFFSKKMELDDAVFYSTDSVEAATTYRFAVKKIKLKVKAVLPMIFEKIILINDLNLEDPDIIVTRLRSYIKDSTKAKDEVSLPREMGRIYHSIQDAIQVLKVKKFELENARFTLVNNIQPGQLPVTIGNIDFHVDNLKVDTAKLTGKEKIFFSENIALKSRDQDILFPDGRHRLNFRKFRINIEKRIVEFDSCTISAIKTDSATAAFSVFFDALQMTNIDFDTLYRAEVIKADSVYCINPQFKLSVDLGKRAGPQRSPPKLDQIIRQLTGDLLLNFVVVNNANFDINTLRNGRPSSFTSQGNNFEMQGLRIDNDAERPLKVKKFAMAIRHYENFLRDSAYEMQFDSILFNDDRIFLSDFSFRQKNNGKTVTNFNVPRFQLTGLSWDDLLFEQKLTAHQATLLKPTIEFIEVSKNKPGPKNQNIFDVLAKINNVMMLEDLNIIDGNIDVRLTGGIEMKLKDATLSIQSRALLGSSKLSEIRRSVNHLDFTRGWLRVNDLTIQLDSVYYTGGNSSLKAGRVNISNDLNTIAAGAGNVTMNEIFINEKTGDISIGETDWQQADINLARLLPASKKSRNSFINLTDLHGNNTKFNYAFGNKTVSAFVDHLSASAFILKPGEKPIVAGLDITGKNLLVIDPSSRISMTSFSVNDQKSAQFVNMRYHLQLPGEMTAISVPGLTFIPDIQSAINGEIRADKIKILRPVAEISIFRKEFPAEKKEWRLPPVLSPQIFIEQPEIHFSRHDEKGTLRIDWNGNNSKTNSVLLQDVSTSESSFTVKQLNLSMNNFVVENTHGKRFESGKGEIVAILNDIFFRKAKGEEVGWQGVLTSVDGKDFRWDSMGRKEGRLDINNFGLMDLSVRSSPVNSIRKILQVNKTLHVQDFTGSYSDSDNRFSWFNAGYDKSSKHFSLDSFIYFPSLSRDSFVARHPYQTDYLQAKTGAVNARPIDLDAYLTDSTVSAGLVKIDDVRFSDFRDNRHPFEPGIIKPLMSNRIKSIPFKISVDTILLQNAQAIYSELNAKTNQIGVIPVTRMTLRIFPVRNYGLTPTDSLRIQVNGYLMDSIWVRLRLRESYLDSLSGFLFTARMRAADMRVLNPVLGPLTSTRLKSAYLDTMSMRVAGGDYLAYGEMKMLYHDLKVELLINGSPKKGGLLSFLINSFIVRNNNTRRTGNVFFVRNRERSSLNYLVKIVMSGVNTSIGAKSNRKILRQYKKELRQRNLPPVDYD